MSLKRVFYFLMFEVIVTVPIGLMIYWLLSFHTKNFTSENTRLYLHGVVMLFAFTYILAQGIALLRACPASRGCAKITHATCNTLSFVFGLAGLILIASYKQDNGKSHFTSLHSWCGLLLLFIMLVQFIGGNAVLQSCCKGASLKSRLNYAPNHAAMGITILLLAAVCVVSGVVNLKSFLIKPQPGRAADLDYELDFENTLLNLIVISSILLFIVILCVTVSRRSRVSANAYVHQNIGGLKNLDFRDTDYIGNEGDPQKPPNTRSSVRSKPISSDTAYSSGVSGNLQRSGSSRRSRDQQAQEARDPRPHDPHAPPPRPHDPHAPPPRRDSNPYRDRPDGRGIPEEIPSPGTGRNVSYDDQMRQSKRSIREYPQQPPPKPERPISPVMRSPPHDPRLPHDPRSEVQYNPHHSRSPERQPRVNGNPTPNPHVPFTSDTFIPHLDLYNQSHEPYSPEQDRRRPHSPQSPSLNYDVSPDMPQFRPNPEPQFRPNPDPQFRPNPETVPYKLPYLEHDNPAAAYPVNGHHVPNTLPSQTSSPDIPPLFDPGISHLRASRKGVPVPLDLAPPPPGQFAPVNVVNPLPSQYGGVAVRESDLPTTFTTTDTYDPSSPDNYNPNYNPANSDNYNPNYNPANSPPTTFSARAPVSQKQAARHYRYNARKAKVEQANLELQRPVTPPASSYTESLAPYRPSTSPVALSFQGSAPEITDSIISDDVDGHAPRRGRTSYRNAVREEEPQPAPPKNTFELEQKQNDDNGICWL